MNEKAANKLLLNNSFESLPHNAKRSFPSEKSNPPLHNPTDQKASDLLNNNTSAKCITFQIANTQNKSQIDIRLAIKAYPSILSNINIDTGLLLLPDWIDIKTLHDYITYVKLSLEPSDREACRSQQFNFKRLVQLANHFDNEAILNEMMQSNIIPNISTDNCVSLINDAFQYVKQLHNEALRKLWGDLLIRLRRFLIDNFDELLEHFSKLKALERNILKDVVESYLMENTKESIEEIRISQLMNVIYHLRDEGDSSEDEEKLFELIHKERQCIKEELNRTELKGNVVSYIVDLADFISQYVSKQVKGSFEVRKVYHKQEIVFTITYNAEEDEMIVALKMNTFFSIYKLLSISAIVFLQEDKGKQKRIVQILSANAKNNNASVLMRISSFSKFIHSLLNGKDNFSSSNSISLSITIKINLFETFILQYLIDHFTQLHTAHSIIKIPCSIVTPFVSIALDDFLLSNETVLSFVMLWLIDNSNKKDNDITVILEIINWEKIALGRIFEFIIKFPHFLSRSSIEKRIISAIVTKTRRKFFKDDLSAFSSNRSLLKSDLKPDALISSLPLSIISYFFVNLVECGKRMQFVQTLITLDSLVNQLKNSPMVVSTVANNKFSDYLSASTAQLIKAKTRNGTSVNLQPYLSSSSMNQSAKVNACNIDLKLPGVTESELVYNKEIKESKQSDSKSENKKSTEYSNRLLNKSYEAFSQGSGKSLYQTPPPIKKSIASINKMNKKRKPIVDIFFHMSNNDHYKHIKKTTEERSKSISKIHIKAYK